MVFPGWINEKIQWMGGENSSSSKLQVPLNFTHTASSWVASFKTIQQYPTKESAENGHCIPNLATPSHSLLQNPKESCLSCRSCVPFTSSHLSDEDLEVCRTSVLMVRLNCCDVDSPETWRISFRFFLPKKGETHRQKKRKHSQKQLWRHMKTWRVCIDFFLGKFHMVQFTISISSNIQPKPIKVNNKTSSLPLQSSLSDSSRCVCSWLARRFWRFFASLKLTWK